MGLKILPATEQLVVDLIAVHTAIVDAHQAEYTDAMAEAVSINNVSEDATPQLGGDVDLNSHGIFIIITHAVAAGYFVYMNGTVPTLALADDSATMPAIGISMVPADNTIMIDGIYTTAGLTAGAIYYVGTDGLPAKVGDGNFPVLATEQLQRIGVALSATQLLLQISIDVLTL